MKLIVFDMDSNGGEVAGCFELAEDIFNARSIKPSVAIVDAACYSAAYALASAAHKIIVTPSGGAGSIGVVATHFSYQKMIDEAGLAVTFIYSGDHKVDGNPYQDLPDSVRAGIQTRVDETRHKFVALVARNRGLDAKVVYDTEAECYSADEALQLGLIDAVAPPSTAVSAYLNELSGSNFEKDSEMTTTATKPGAESKAAATIDDKAAAPTTSADKEVAPAVSAATPSDERAAERDRIKAIMSHEAAKGKSALANHLALSTDLSVEAAAGILEAAPAEKGNTPASANAFAAAMDASEHPNVGAGGEEGAGDEGMTAAQRILKAQALATGVKL